MYTGLFFSSFFVAFSGAVMPGPLLTATIGTSARCGPSAGPLFIAGHAILELGLVAALLIGLGPFINSQPVFVAISIIGSFIMLYMAIGMLRSLPHLSLRDNVENKDEQNSEIKKGPLIGAGALLSLSNPYWTIWWGTIGLTFLIRARQAGGPGIASFFSGHILGDLAWYSFISFTIWKGKSLFTDRIYRILIATCALALGIFGLLFLTGGIQTLLKRPF